MLVGVVLGLVCLCALCDGFRMNGGHQSLALTQGVGVRYRQSSKSVPTATVQRSSLHMTASGSGKFDSHFNKYSSIATALGASATPMASGIVPDGGISPCVIKVVGVGGGGGNAVMRMIETGVTGVDFCAVNTDLQALARFGDRASTLNIGREVTRGLGAGGVADNGRKAAEESRAEIMKMVSGSDLVFVTAGMGGGTGSGAAPVVAEIAREAGALTVGVVTKPFAFEGRRRMSQALAAIDKLRAVVDTMIIVSNDRLLQIIPENTPLQRAFSVADDVLRQGVVGISEIIIRPGLINVDFADVRAIMGDAGTALMGIGRGAGRNRAVDAAKNAISSPLLDFPIEQARGVVFNIVGGNDLTLQEINAAAEIIFQAVDPNANIIFGSLVDENMDGEVAITVIATGFPTGADSDSDSVDHTIAAADNEESTGATQRDYSPRQQAFARTKSSTVNGARRLPLTVPTAFSSHRSFANPTPAVATTRATPVSTSSDDNRNAEKSTSSSSRIASVDDDFPDFLSKLKKRRP